MPRAATLSDSCTSDRRCLSILALVDLGQFSAHRNCVPTVQYDTFKHGIVILVNGHWRYFTEENIPSEMCSFTSITMTSFNVSFLTRKYSFVLWIHAEKYISDCFQIKRNMIIATVFLLIRNQMEICLVHNHKENWHNDHILLILKESRIYYSVWLEQVFRGTIKSVPTIKIVRSIYHDAGSDRCPFAQR